MSRDALREAIFLPPEQDIFQSLQDVHTLIQALKEGWTRTILCKYLNSMI
jgi:hypothetical protein